MKRLIGLLLLSLVQPVHSSPTPVIERCKTIIFKASSTTNNEFMVCKLDTGRYAYRQRGDGNVTFFVDSDKVTNKRITTEGIYAAEMVVYGPDDIVYRINVWSRENRQPDGQVKIIKGTTTLKHFDLKSSTITSKIGTEET